MNVPFEAATMLTGNWGWSGLFSRSKRTNQSLILGSVPIRRYTRFLVIEPFSDERLFGELNAKDWRNAVDLKSVSVPDLCGAKSTLAANQSFVANTD